MKYVVTGYATDWVEVEAESETEAEQIGVELLGPPKFWDYHTAEEMEDEEWTD